MPTLDSLEGLVDTLKNQVEEKSYRQKTQKLRDILIERNALELSRKENPAEQLAKARLLNKIEGIDDSGIEASNLDEYIAKLKKKKLDRERTDALNSYRQMPEEEWKKVQLYAQREALNAMLPPVKHVVEDELTKLKERMERQNEALRSELLELKEQAELWRLEHDNREMQRIIDNRKALLTRSDDNDKIRQFYSSLRIYNQSGSEFGRRVYKSVDYLPFEEPNSRAYAISKHWEDGGTREKHIFEPIYELKYGLMN